MKTWEKIKQEPELIEKYLVREKVVDSIRKFFKKSGFHEVSTPILVPVPSAESNLEVFETQLRTFTGQIRRGFLIMSPEYSLKKLLAAGIGSVFEITKAFRNDEEVSPSHNHEFSILEWYRVNADYRNIMEDFENMFLEIIKSLDKNINLKHWEYQGKHYNLEKPWDRISVAEAFNKYSGISEEELINDKLVKKAKLKGYEVDSKTTWEEAFYQIFLNEIEPKLRDKNKPVFLYDYPLQQASLSKRSKSNPNFAERFEVYLAGIELGNCFSELTDAKEQEERLKKDIEERIKSGKTPYGIDKDFIRALASGMPEVAGIAVGVDRLVMLAGNFGDIKDTLFFPTSELFDLEGA